jgi:6-pyruvoyltetrahydropterin/6-carboxytetrahydropterin synthase
MRISIFRKGHFNSAHQLAVPSWSDEKNKEIFGKCANPNFHGHNYELVVKLTGDVDPETGMLINLKDLKELIKREIEDRFDHKNLNLDCPEFNRLIPTAENLCFVIWGILRKKLDQKLDLTVRLFETERNFVEYPAS